jgi:putative ABC transport system permease protein
MTSLISGNMRMAIQSIRSTKTRSLLTMLGIIIGVASVITSVSLGEGIRSQVASNIKTGDKNAISIRPGKFVKRNNEGKITSIDYSGAIGASTLNDQDVQRLSKLPNVSAIIPLSTISALAKTTDGKEFDATVIGTTSEFASASGQKVAYGSFFDDDQNGRQVAIIGKSVAEQLFEQNVPIGQAVVLRGREFMVQGVLDSFNANALSNGNDLNRAIFIPYNTAKSISGNAIDIYQILAQPKDNSKTLAKDITTTLTSNHGDQQNFTVLTQEETLQVAGHALTSLTTLIAGIAAISLIVGGIGIMNIMFVSVTERTREIGVRKSLGATNQQIYSQFAVEATILSLVGGILGVILAMLANFFIKIFTSLTPVATLPIIVMSVGVASLIGIIFGTVPAIKAARKDPIQSLRYE